MRAREQIEARCAEDERTFAARRARTTTTTAPAPRALPMFERGIGDRREDCESYDGCLTRFLAPTRGPQLPGRRQSAAPDLHARCPPTCASYAATPTAVRHHLAHVYGHRSED